MSKWRMYGLIGALTLLIGIRADGQIGQSSRPNSPGPEHARVDWCGTEVTPDQIALELERSQTGLRPFLRPGATTYYVPVSFHIVRRSNGTGGMSPEKIHKDMQYLNQYFQQAGIQFYRLHDGSGHAIHYVDNDTHYNGTYPHTGLRSTGSVSNTINVYYVPDLSPYSGMSSYPSSTEQGVLIGYQYSGLSRLLAHEIGHYLNLYHTHETAYGVECPNGNNCSVAGDLLCDTPADPNLGDPSYVDSNCLYIGPSGPPAGCIGTYHPQVSNLMSYASDECKSLLTSQQISRILDCLTLLRPGLASTDMTDSDGDGIRDVIDNCPSIANPGQEDADGDFIGDVCDVCPNDIRNDIDGDGVCSNADNCEFAYNPDQFDVDADGVGDSCECGAGALSKVSDQTESRMGHGIAFAGDVDGDGYDDVVVGEPQADVPTVDAGRTMVYSGKTGQLLLTVLGEAVGDHFGTDVSRAGDVNKDGYADFLVGAACRGNSGAGKAYLILGSPGPFPSTVGASSAYRTYSRGSGSWFGITVADAGDINSDGYDDHLVCGLGTTWDVLVYSGQTGTLLRTFSGTSSQDGFGLAMCSAGRVDADTVPDILIGAPAYASAPGVWSGKVFIYSGADGNLIRSRDFSVAAQMFGFSVACAGDVNNDGRDDQIVGAPWTARGRTYVYSGLDGTLLNTFTGGQWYGWAVCGLRDLNKDGFDDYAISDASSGTTRGSVTVHSGKDGTVLFSVHATTDWSWFGQFVRGDGDLNKDGANDLLVAAPAAMPIWFDLGKFAESPIAPRVYAYLLGDPDADGIQLGCDNCPAKPNPGQQDNNQNGIGDVCESCCNVSTGNVDCDPANGVDIADLSALIDNLYISFTPLCCQKEANIDGSSDGNIDISDLSALIDYLYISFTPPAACM